MLNPNPNAGIRINYAIFLMILAIVVLQFIVFLMSNQVYNGSYGSLWPSLLKNFKKKGLTGLMSSSAGPVNFDWTASPTLSAFVLSVLSDSFTSLESSPEKNSTVAPPIYTSTPFALPMFPALNKNSAEGVDVVLSLLNLSELGKFHAESYQTSMASLDVIDKTGFFPFDTSTSVIFNNLHNWNVTEFSDRPSYTAQTPIAILRTLAPLSVIPLQSSKMAGRIGREAALSVTRHPMTLTLAEFFGRFIFHKVNSISTDSLGALVSVLDEMKHSDLDRTIACAIRFGLGHDRLAAEVTSRPRLMSLMQEVRNLEASILKSSNSSPSNPEAARLALLSADFPDGSRPKNYGALNAIALDLLSSCMPIPVPSATAGVPPTPRAPSFSRSNHASAVLASSIYYFLRHKNDVHEGLLAALSSSAFQGGATHARALIIGYLFGIEGNIDSHRALHSTVYLGDTKASVASLSLQTFMSGKFEKFAGAAANLLSREFNIMQKRQEMNSNNPLKKKSPLSTAAVSYKRCYRDCHTVKPCPAQTKVGPIIITITCGPMIGNQLGQSTSQDFDSPSRATPAAPGPKPASVVGNAILGAWRMTYHAKIEVEKGSEAVWRFTRRHWVMEHGTGRLEEVEGPGVGGKVFSLAPGKSFEYDSWTSFDAPHGTMQGAYTVEFDRWMDGISRPAVEEQRVFEVNVGPFGLNQLAGVSPGAVAAHFRSDLKGALERGPVASHALPTPTESASGLADLLHLHEEETGEETAAGESEGMGDGDWSSMIGNVLDEVLATLTGMDADDLRDEDNNGLNEGLIEDLQRDEL